MDTAWGVANGDVAAVAVGNAEDDGGVVLLEAGCRCLASRAVLPDGGGEAITAVDVFGIAVKGGVRHGIR